MASPHAKALRELREAHFKGILLGLNGVSGIKQRLDIDVLLLKQPQTFNLFLLAFDKSQNDPDLSNIKMSYFQIAGKSALAEQVMIGRNFYTASQVFTVFRRPCGMV